MAHALETRLLPGEVAYEGAPLRGHWAYREHGVRGNSLLAFTGPVHVAVGDLADLEDARQGAFIRGKRMLHFVLELFGPDLEQAVARQWLMAATAQDEINRSLNAYRVSRSGNDLWVGRRKLSVSIAAPTGVSVKVHLGLNVDASGAPVPAVGLDELKVPARPLARRLLARFAADHATMGGAREKVRLYV